MLHLKCGVVPSNHSNSSALCSTHVACLLADALHTLCLIKLKPPIATPVLMHSNTSNSNEPGVEAIVLFSINCWMLLGINTFCCCCCNNNCWPSCLRCMMLIILRMVCRSVGCLLLLFRRADMVLLL